MERFVSAGFTAQLSFHLIFFLSSTLWMKPRIWHKKGIQLMYIWRISSANSEIDHHLTILLLFCLIIKCTYFTLSWVWGKKTIFCIHVKFQCNWQKRMCVAARYQRSVVEVIIAARGKMIQSQLCHNCAHWHWIFIQWMTCKV